MHTLFTRPLGALLVMALAAAGCSTSEPDRSASATRGASPSSPTTPTLTEPPRGIHLSFIQQRFDESTNRAQVRIINNTDSFLPVRDVGIDWPGFPGGLQKTDSFVPAGLTVDMRYVLPRADCSESAGAAPAYAIITSKKRRIRKQVPEDGMRFLDRLWRTACNERKVRRAVDIRLGDGWGHEGSGLDAVLHQQLLLDRQAEVEAVVVEQAQGSVLFELTMPGDRELPEGAEHAALPLDISPGRCDEHGRSQSQQTFIWRVWLSLDGSEPIPVIVKPDEPHQVRLMKFLDMACG